MKKLRSLIFALALVLALPLPALAARDEQTLTLAGAGAEETVGTFRQRGSIYRRISVICSATVAGKWNFYHVRADNSTEVLITALPNDHTGADAALNDVIEYVPDAARPFLVAKFDPSGAGAGTAFCEFVFQD